ncbi:DUF1214 domain-containing protein [Terrihabitans sp. B22-R8]|uniref:DUF1214 domain-containing protein n=1 Tax=Terrihabitans sp. B22-R8 TaxID=3425128 RepID=UPI00403CF190
MPLRGACRYRVHGLMPNVRVWSLSAYSDAGAIIPNAAHRYAFSSAEMARDFNGAVSIQISAQAQSGNWLPAPLEEEFILVLRMYDTTLGAISGGRDAPDLPAITRVGCPS